MPKPSTMDSGGGHHGRIARNSFYIFLSRFVEFGAGLAIVVLVANHFGVREFGRFSFIRAVAFVLGPLMMFGTMRIVVREISVDKTRTAEILRAALVLNVVMSAATAVFAAGVPLMFRLEGPAVTTSIYLALLTQSCLAMISTINAGFIAHEIANFAALVSITNRVLVIAALVVVIGLQKDLATLFGGILCANFVGLMTALLVLKLSRILSDAKGMLWANMKFLFRESYPIAAVVFLVQGYTYLNTFLLRYVHDNWHVAMFEASQRIILPLSLISTSILLAFVPMLSRLGKDPQTHEQLLKVYASTLKFFILLTLPACAVVALFAEPIILLIYNEDFIQAALSLRILIWTIVPLFANGLLNFLLTALYKQRLLLISNVACFVVNAVFGVLLVKEFGVAGVSLAALLAFVILFGVNYHFVNVHLGCAQLIPMTVVPALTTLLFYGAASFFVARPVYRLVGVMLYLLVYVVILWLARIISWEELRRLVDSQRRQPRVAGSRP